MGIKEQLLKIPAIRSWKRSREKARFSGSEAYWEQRYQSGGNSGSGSYDQLAHFKAEILNDFVRKNAVQSVIEFGCGDGNQLSLSDYPRYMGLDVSPTAVNICHDKFKGDPGKGFYLYSTTAFYDPLRVFHADLALSLDVLFHLVEKEIHDRYLLHLFGAADRFVIIYSSDYDQKEEPIHQHENRRGFTRFVENNLPGWKLREVIRNRYPTESYGLKGSLSDFYIYEKNT
jgi:hypothetical protein